MKDGEFGLLARRQLIKVALGITATATVSAPGEAGHSSVGNTLTGAISPRRLVPTTIQSTTIDDAFWSPKLKVWRDVTIEDCFTKFEHDRGGAINNFDLVRDGKTGQHAGPPWYDGLIYEMIRGAADFLAMKRDPNLEARIDGYITKMVAAQAKDQNGYLNTWTQTMLPQTQRWGMNGGDDREQHDIYNAGMMIEAGVHYYLATGKAVLLEAATRIANLMCDTIGNAPRANAIPGHSGPEEALVKLYTLFRGLDEAKRRVGVPVTELRYLELAQYFIDARGHYEGRTGRASSFGEYGQDHAPLALQTSLTGHAVRATLFANGVAAAANVTGRADYMEATLRFWDSLTRRKMYITGAAGAIAGEQKLGPDYFLPNDGYMETCAAVGLAFFSHAMNLLYADASYVDELERALYNAVLGGVSLSGRNYYYQNPLTTGGLRRWDWHECPCCPPMFLKVMGALPSYIYAQEAEAIYVNLFISSHTRIELGQTAVQVRLETKYPWNGKVELTIAPERPKDFDIYVRIPGWSRKSSSPDGLYQNTADHSAETYRLSINGKAVAPMSVERGYARIRRRWQPGDTVHLELAMPFRKIIAKPGVEADRGRTALMRGPVVYCGEVVDNPEGLQHLIVDDGAKLLPTYKPDLLDGVVLGHGLVRAQLSQNGTTKAAYKVLTVVPFYAAANREILPMQVWFAHTKELAKPATLAMRSRAAASHCWHLDSVAAINDGIVPASSQDIANPRLSWWDHKGTVEWAELHFPEPAIISGTRIFWFADRPAKGGCDVPASWRLLFNASGVWLPVEHKGEYGVQVDTFNETKFVPVRSTALRVEVQLKSGWSAGICEWQVLVS